MTGKRFALAALTVIALWFAPATAQEAQVVEVLDFSQLDGWEEDDHSAALAVFSQTCDLMGARNGRNFANFPETHHQQNPFSSCFSDPS